MGSIERVENSSGAVGLSRRWFLGSLAALVATGSRRHEAAAGDTRPDRAARGGGKGWTLDDFAKHIKPGGPPKDGIPPIDRPRYVAAAQGEKFLRPDDVVFGLAYAGAVRAYPQKVLVWHEIVNDEVGGGKISVTYCPLTGSAVAFRGRSKLDGAPLTFGTTGKLVNSNLLMYDRQTDSQWPQILGAAISGPNKGAALEEIPLDWTTWERWRRQHPDSTVLSTETGFLRSYGSDPYGSYSRSGTYYDSGEPFFPVMATDRRFPAKHVVIGAKIGRSPLAVSKTAVAQQRAINGSLGQTPLVALYDEEVGVVRIFERRAGGKVLDFRPAGATFVDDKTAAPWTARGRCEGGPLRGAQLPLVPSYDVMWFAWFAFFPETDVWTEAKG